MLNTQQTSRILIICRDCYSQKLTSKYANVPAGKRNYQTGQKHRGPYFRRRRAWDRNFYLNASLFYFLLPLSVVTGSGTTPDLCSSMGSAWPARNKQQSPEGKWTKVLVPCGASVTFCVCVSLWAEVLVYNLAAMCRICHTEGFWISEFRSWNAVLFRATASWDVMFSLDKVSENAFSIWGNSKWKNILRNMKCLQKDRNLSSVDNTEVVL